MRSAAHSAALVAIGGLSLIAIAGFALSGGSGARAQATNTIQVGDVWFCSVSSADGVCETTISAGDTVTWDWVGTLFHTTTACSGSDFATCDAAQGWDSPVQDSGSFTQTLTTAGTFYYKCLVHPGPPVPGSFMRGAITVLAQPTPTPTPTAQPSPEPSLQPTPQPAAVPTGGGEPPSDSEASALWRWALSAGGLLVATAAFALRGLRR